MTMIGTGFVLAVGLVALLDANDATASSDVRMQCMQPIVRNMTIYRPSCGGIDQRGWAAGLPSVCLTRWWALETPCSSFDYADWPTGKGFTNPYNNPP